MYTWWWPAHTRAAGNGDLNASLENFAINGAALALFGWLFYRDYSKQEADNRQILREEALGRLQVRRGACSRVRSAQ